MPMPDCSLQFTTLVYCSEFTTQYNNSLFYVIPTIVYNKLKMRKAICRLCLSDNNLTALFKNKGQTEEFTSNLFITTGLKIEPNDGLPQHICEMCDYAVTSALELRKRSTLSEQQLLNQRNQIHISNTLSNEEADPQNNEKSINYLQDFDDIDDYTDMICESDLELILDESDTEMKRKDSDTEMKRKDSDTEMKRKDSDTEMKRKDSVDESHTELKTKDSAMNDLDDLDDFPELNKSRQRYLDLVEGQFDRNGPFKCKICQGTVNKWISFIGHVRKHLGYKLVCEYCGLRFISTHTLNRHCRSLHGMKKVLQCQQCSYLALDNQQLKLHIRRMHTGEKPFVCEVCAAAYYSRRGLRQHLAISHKDDAQVKCGSCPRVFVSHRALNRHRYTTHAVNRVPCPHCAKLYTRKYLSIHIWHNHADIFGTNSIHVARSVDPVRQDEEA